MIALTQKNTLLKTAANQPTTNVFKRVFFSPPKEKFNNKKFPTPYKNKTSFYRTVKTLTDNALIVNHYKKSDCKLDTSTLRTDRRASGNSTYPNVAVQWLNQALCFYQSFCLVDSFELRNRHLRVAAKRQAVKKLFFF